MAQEIQPAIVTAQELKVSFGEYTILDNASLTIHRGDRIGLIGRNGSGKSTFLKIIAGTMTPDNGDVILMNDLRIGYLPQTFDLDPEATVRQSILEGCEHITHLLHIYQNLDPMSEKRVYYEEKIIQVDGWNLDNRIARITKELSASEPDRQIKTLSGGEKRRVALCRAVISNPDFIILDEPTNHLDTDSIEWTEEFLANYSGACLFVTHDRYFLDRIANRIVELWNGEFHSHQGNYTDYLINKAQRQEQAEVEDQKRQKFLRKELQWVSGTPRARRTKQKARIDTYFDVLNQKTPEDDLNLDLILPPADRLGKKVLEIKDVSMDFGGKRLIEHFSLLFEPGRKMGVVGRNGIGKTTLLKLILGELQPTMGKISVAENTSFNYIDQHRMNLNDDLTVYQEIAEGKDHIMFAGQRLSVYSYLRRYLFTDERINTKVSRLSGGERSRLVLAKILKKGGNFLLMDEPTNDLDLPTLRILEEALISFGGCLMVVSHDRYFLNRVCNGILAFEGDGQLYQSEGDYDYYIEKRNARREKLNSQNEQNNTKGDTRPPKKNTKKLKWKEEKELEAMEENILEAEAEVERIETIFTDPEFHEKYAEKTKELTEELESAKVHVKKLYDRWEELEELKNS